MLIHGSCHCGNIASALVWEPGPRDIKDDRLARRKRGWIRDVQFVGA